MKNLDFYNAIIKLQRDELFEKEVYLHIAKFIKDDKDRETLIRIANSEVEHYEIWKKYTKVDVKPSKIKVYIYTFFAWLFGYTFV